MTPNDAASSPAAASQEGAPPASEDPLQRGKDDNDNDSEEQRANRLGEGSKASDSNDRSRQGEQNREPSRKRCC